MREKRGITVLIMHEKSNERTHMWLAVTFRWQVVWFRSPEVHVTGRYLSFC